MTFLNPWFLLLLLPVAALAVAYVVQHRRRGKYAVRFATQPMLARLVPKRPGWRRHLPAGLLLLAFVFLGSAAARPEVELRVPRDTATIVVAIDTSRSMNATDVEPNRLEAASRAARTFVEDLPPRFNVGVVGFAGSSAVLMQPTTDHGRAADVLRNLSLGDATAIGEGIFTSLEVVDGQKALSEVDEVPARVVLLSDGENTAGRSPSEAATAARAAGVPVSTIAYGTESGGATGFGQQRVGVDTAALRGVAETSGGTAYTAASSDELNEVYDDIQRTIGWRTEPVEITPYLAAFALLVGLAGAAFSLRWFVRLP